jgi:hypothetical protein
MRHMTQKDGIQRGGGNWDTRGMRYIENLAQEDRGELGQKKGRGCEDRKAEEKETGQDDNEIN